MAAVARAALAQMAATIEQQQAEADDGTEMLRGVGLGYIRFALDEPGWFDVAFSAMADMVNATAPGSGGAASRSLYQQLEDALVCLVRDKLLDGDRVGDAAVMCWAGVHGFATLTSCGPLREVPQELVEAQAGQLVADIVDAVTRPRRIG